MKNRTKLNITEHLELSELRKGPRYAYRDAKLLCDLRDTYETLSYKLDTHAKV